MGGSDPDEGAEWAAMSGSGSTIVGAFLSHEDALIQPGDLVIWNLRTFHSAGASSIRLIESQDFR